MAIRDKLAQRSIRFLEPGEQVQAVFIGLTGPSPYWSFVSEWIIVLTRGYTTIAATDRAIVVLRNGWFLGTRPQSVIARHPRKPMDDPSGLWFALWLNDTRYWVSRRYHKDIRAANAAIPGGPPNGYGY
jgi:hypothetical protein